MKKDINPKNDKGDLHGYQEIYDSYGALYYIGIWKNNRRIGYQEWHRVKKTEYYIR